MATLVAAVVAALAAIASGAIAALSAKRIGHANWLRVERRAAYARFLAATRAILLSARMKWHSDIVHSPELTKLVSMETVEPMRQLQEALAELELLGPYQVIEAAKRYASIALIFLEPADFGLPSPDIALGNTGGRHEREVEQAFIDAARRALEK